MIPEPGRDRDKLIAEMRGLKQDFACFILGDERGKPCVWDAGDTESCIIAHRGITKGECSFWESSPEDWPPHYSTDLLAAWELWEELPMPKSIDQIRGDHWCVCWGDSFNPDFIGTTFPDAVSAAWIEWKRREGGK